MPLGSQPTPTLPELAIVAELSTAELHDLLKLSDKPISLDLSEVDVSDAHNLESFRACVPA